MYKRLLLLTIVSLALYSASAQQYLEFIENKGQWDKNIQFKGDMNTGAFVLKPDGGYRVLLNNRDDLAALGDYFHGHIHNPGKNPSNDPDSKKSAPNTEGGNKKVLASSGQVAQQSAIENGGSEGGGGNSSGGGGSSNNSGNSSSNNDILLIRSHVYEVTFLNANPHPVAVPDKPLNSYNNYFIGNDSSKWASNCKIYNAVTYKNIYPNIDVRYYTDNGGSLKYDLIVNPGGDVSRIALYFAGTDGVRVKNGQLVIKTSVDEVKEMEPVSYEAGAAGRRTVNCNYTVSGSIVRFHVDANVSKQSTLIIDPQLVFSTFTGSTVSNWGFTATYDALGNFYAGGIVFGQGFPVNNGAFQTKFAGGANTGEGGAFDMGVMKFNPNGTNRLFATYVGGATGNDYPHSMVCDAAGNVVISGKTTSSDYPSTAPTYGTGGGYDIVLTKLNTSGTALMGSRRIGGTGDDGVNIKNKYPVGAGNNAISLRRNYGDDSRSEVIVDGAGNIYLASCTQSAGDSASGGFPVTANAFQKTNASANSGNGFKQDAVVIKTSPDLSTILFSTYLGGSGDDAAFVLALNPVNNNIYVAGGTGSQDFPGNKTGVLFPAYQGDVADGFVAVISNDGSTLIKSSYFGTSGVDIIYGIQFDRNNYPYIMGTTTGSWPTTNNVNFIQPGGKQFISKLQQDLSAFVYSTVFGTNAAAPNISPTAFLVDRCENVYVSGWGGWGDSKLGYPNSGTAGLTITADAYQSTTDGSDFYFIVLSRNAQTQLYGSFFGQNGGNYPDHVDGGTSRFDRNGVIYQAVCANCGGGARFPTSAGVWSPNNGALAVGGCNLAAIKIAFNLAGVGSAVRSIINGIPGKTSGCVPLTVNFVDTIGNAQQYVWDFGDGSPRQTTTVPNTSHLYNTVGNFKVMLISIDSTSCNIADTSYLNIKVRSDEAILKLNVTKLLPCTALNYQFDNLSTPSITKPFQKNSFVLRYGDGAMDTITSPQTTIHNYAAPGTYNVSLVLIDSNYCNAMDSIIVPLRIAPNVKAQFETPPAGCAPYLADINNTSLAGQTFVWDFGDGTKSTDPNPAPHLYPNPGTYTISLHVVDNNTCNQVSDTSITINVFAKPVAAFTATPQPPVVNTPIVFTNNSTGGVIYKWSFGDGDTLTTFRLDTLVSHVYNASGTYNVCLTTFNKQGCDSIFCESVQALVSPLVDVPNALSPGGNNKKIFVRGFGIEKMTWRIYNRWGTLVFQTTNQNEGWDGTYNGKLQAMDVYTYTLEVEFSDGTRASKKGDITLLR